MLLEEFDAEKYERTIREEGREAGVREGIEIGRKPGRRKRILWKRLWRNTPFRNPRPRRSFCGIGSRHNPVNGMTPLHFADWILQ